jgi:hypothetical protein
MPATDFQSLLSDPNVPCYLNMASGAQNAIELALLQDIAQNIGTPTPSWTPQTPGTLVEWLKADALSLSDGTSVSDWTASVGNDATAGGVAQPTFKLNIQNGKPVVRFNGTTNNMQIGLFSSAVNQPFTLAIAYAYRGITSSTTTILGGTSTITNFGTQSADFVFSAGGSILSAGPCDNNFHIAFLVFNGASSMFALDGAPLVTVSSSPGTGNLIDMTIGSQGFGGAINESQVDFGELCLWTGDGASYYSNLFSYMNNRWA